MTRRIKIHVGTYDGTAIREEVEKYNKDRQRGAGTGGERMSTKSKIEWTDATWNVVTGCTKVSPGCANCYAEKMARRLQAMGTPRYSDGFNVAVHSDLLGLPLHWRKPRRVFVDSMGDLFHNDVPMIFIHKVFAVMGQASQHTFQILTKRSERLLRVGRGLPWHPNVWMGVSVEEQEYDYRIGDLLQVQAVVRFVSLEPLLRHVDLNKWLPAICPVHHQRDCCGRSADIDWVIVGGETGPGARPFDPDWARDVLKQCRAAGVPFFMKQINKRTPIPDDLMVREFPRIGGAA